MYVDQNDVAKVLKVIQNVGMRNVLSALKLKPLTYVEIRKIVYGTRQIPKSDKGSLTAYYVRLLRENSLIQKDDRTNLYMILRKGIIAIDLIQGFEKLCIKYEMSDCNDEGKIESMVVGRKL